MLDDSDTDMDEMDDLERQVHEFFVDVMSMLEAGNKHDAIDLLQANYEAVKEQMDNGCKDIEQAAILDIVALGYMVVGDLKLVEHLLKMLNEIVVGLHDAKPILDSILMHMGSMYMTLGKFEDAMHVYERGLNILEKEVGNYSPTLITPLMGMAKVSRLCKRATDSVALYNRTIDIMERNRGLESEELVVPLFSLGNLFISEGKAADAETCFNRILSICTNAYGENDGRVGMAMCTLGRALCAKGSAEEAISRYEKGLKIIESSKYMSPDDEVLEKLRVDLAELLHGTGREQEGRKVLEECLLITERYKGMEHPSSVAHLQNLAISYSQSKNFVEAERLLRTCLHILSKTVGPKDQSITVPMLLLAVVLYHLQQDEEAEGLALEVLHIREDAFGKESLPVGEALDCLVSIQTRLGRNNRDLLVNLQRILSIQEKEFGYESKEVMETLKKIVFYMDKLDNQDGKLPLRRRLSFLRAKYKQEVHI